MVTSNSSSGSCNKRYSVNIYGKKIQEWGEGGRGCSSSALGTVPTSRKSEWMQFLFGISLVFLSLLFVSQLFPPYSAKLPCTMDSVTSYCFNSPTMLSLWPAIPQNCSKLHNYLSYSLPVKIALPSEQPISASF